MARPSYLIRVAMVCAALSACSGHKSLLSDAPTAMPTSGIVARAQPKYVVEEAQRIFSDKRVCYASDNSQVDTTDSATDAKRKADNYLQSLESVGAEPDKEIESNNEALVQAISGGQYRDVKSHERVSVVNDDRGSYIMVRTASGFVGCLNRVELQAYFGNPR